MHAPHSEYYIRRSRLNEDSPQLPVLVEAGYTVEADVMAPNTQVVEVPVHEKDFWKSKADVSMREQLELAAKLQHYWSDNSVSSTVHFREEEIPDLSSALEDYQDRLKSISFLPFIPEEEMKSRYKQIPYESITQGEYEDMMSRIKTPTLDQLLVGHDLDEKYCTTDSCEIREFQSNT
jgi:hypothetical protein